MEVTGLFIYPVKGLKGIAKDRAVLTPTGFEYDRHWMVVMPNGRMVTQRQIPEMALLTPSIVDGRLIIKAADGDLIDIPLREVPEQRVDVSVWNDNFEALDEGQRISDWLTRVLQFKHPLRLVRMAKDVIRPQSEPALLGPETSTQFADAAPFLVTNESSLDDLNNQLVLKGASPVPMNRFRPNIVISGLEAYSEYQTKQLSESNDRYRLQLCFPCERCIVTTTNQETAEVDRAGQQPLATLREMNTAPGHEGAYFGQNAKLVQGAGETVSIGNQIFLE